MFETLRFYPEPIITPGNWAGSQSDPKKFSVRNISCSLHAFSNVTINSRMCHVAPSVSQISAQSVLIAAATRGSCSNERYGQIMQRRQKKVAGGQPTAEMGEI